MIKKIYTKIYYLIPAVFVIIIDQITKYIMLNNYNILVNKNFIIFRLDFVKNFGAAFNIFSGSRLFLSFISITFALLLFYLILRKKTTDNIDLFAFSFILGGTIGNGLDRILKGFVIDFINLNIINFPVFNISDISINIGFILIIYNIFRKKR